MNKNYQRLLLNELYRYYPDFSDKWIDRLSMLMPIDSPDEEEQKRNMFYLLEKKFIEYAHSQRASLRITASGIEYLEKLNAEIETEKVK